MSTSTVAQDVQSDAVATNSAMDTTSEIYTGGQVIYDTGAKNESGDAVLAAVAVTEKQADEIQTAGTVTVKNNKFNVVSVTKQSATLWKANSLDGITKLSPNDEETCNLFNTAAKAKQIRKFNAALIEVDDTGEYSFNFTEQPYDLADDLAEVTSRRMSPSEKMLATAKSLPPEQLAQVIAALEQLKKLNQ